MVKLTPLQQFQHRFSYFLDNEVDKLTETERQDALTYLVMRATIVLAPSTSERKAG